MRPAVSVLIAVAMFAVAANCIAQDAFSSIPEPLSADERSAVLNGDIVTRARDSVGSAKQGTAVAIVASPINAVVQAITDYDAYECFIPRVEESRIIGTGPAGARVFQRLSIPFMRDRYYRILAREPIRDTPNGQSRVTIPWEYEAGSGNIVANSGSWTLVAISPQRTLLCYRLVGDLGFRLWDALIRFATKQSLPGVVKGVRKRAAQIAGGQPGNC